MRVLSAALLVPLGLGALWVGAPFFPALVVLSAALMSWESARLTLGRQLEAAGLLAIASEVSATLLVVLVDRRLGLLVLFAGAAATFILGWWGRRLASAAWASLGLLWIGLACIAALWLRAEPGSGRATMLWLFALVWASDTGAYAVGRAIGGPLLASRWSPRKTWSGAIGGLLAAGVVGLIAETLRHLPAISPVLWVSLGLSLAAQAGDLLESAAKRRFGAKDSSGLIPGHGGVLDRLDAMLAVLLTAALFTIVGGGSPLLWQ